MGITPCAIRASTMGLFFFRLYVPIWHSICLYLSAWYMFVYPQTADCLSIVFLFSVHLLTACILYVCYFLPICLLIICGMSAAVCSSVKIMSSVCLLYACCLLYASSSVCSLIVHLSAVCLLLRRVGCLLSFYILSAVCMLPVCLLFLRCLYAVGLSTVYMSVLCMSVCCTPVCCLTAIYLKSAICKILEIESFDVTDPKLNLTSTHVEIWKLLDQVQLDLYEMTFH